MTDRSAAASIPSFANLDELLQALDGIARIDGDAVTVVDEAGFRAGLIDRLVGAAVFADEPVRSVSRWLIRAAAPALGAFPASIDALYRAAGRGEYAHATAPAINVRGLTYDVMRTIFRAAHANDCKIFLLELARSEMGYTEQRPGEYAANALAAAIKEGHRGPVFIQGDHYQINAKNYAKDAAAELAAVRDLTLEAIDAGYFNIDIDASTIVDLSLPTIEAQQTLNARHTAEMTRVIRDRQPAAINISVGGEIGEVGGRNSTVEDLRGFMTQYRAALQAQGKEAGRDLEGISKISVQTGTSHGGVVLPDGSIAQVAVDFDTLAKLSEVAREEYGMGGAVQHGASTLPETYFHRFAEANAIEVHLATGFQNRIFDNPAFPANLRDEIYAYLDEKHADERKPEMTDAQFHYTTRKRAWGPFKAAFWSLPAATRQRLMADLEPVFGIIMQRLGVANTGALVDRIVTRVDVPVPAPAALHAARRGEQVAVAAGGERYEQVEGE
ncbi:MAG TPA: class II fructose-bisphosphate aldolase [Thermomicrobiales bacterium]|nr:class II fructose-bisphosphate aldolase [Thermomicrobiales bacterium]